MTDEKTDAPQLQAVTPPTSPPFLGGKQVQAIVGPYAGTVLTMPEAEADQAVSDHWAIELRHPPFDANAEPPHDPLTDEERAGAVTAAQAWANVQWGISDPKREAPKAEPPTEASHGRRHSDDDNETPRRRR